MPYSLDGVARLLRRLAAADAAAAASSSSPPPPPLFSFHAVHIAGTNGKGSAAAFAASVLRCARAAPPVGLFTSPGLLDPPRDMIRDAGAALGASEYDALIARVRAADTAASDFEVATAAAIAHFGGDARRVAVFETGLGGTHDATNVLPGGKVAAITRVGGDHADVLGATTAEVAAHKAGIIKSGDIVVVLEQGEDVMRVVRDRARAVGAAEVRVVRPFAPGVRVAFGKGGEWRSRAGGEKDKLLIDWFGADVRVDDVGLRGVHQLENLAVAVGVVAACVDKGWLEVSSDALRSGISEARWPGRCDVRVFGGCKVVIDGAHNADGASALRRFLDDQGSKTDGPRVFVFGASRGKDVAGILARLLRVGDRVHVREFATPEGRPPCVPRAEVEAAVVAAGGVVLDRDPLAGVAGQPGAQVEENQVVVCGSLYLVARVYRELGIDVSSL